MRARQLMSIPVVAAVGAIAVVAGAVLWHSQRPDRALSLASVGVDTCTLDLTVRPSQPPSEPVPITMFIETGKAGCRIPSSFATVIRDSGGAELAAITAAMGCQVPGCDEVGPHDIYTHIEWWPQTVGSDRRQAEPGTYTAEVRWSVAGAEHRSRQAVFEIDTNPKPDDAPRFGSPPAATMRGGQGQTEMERGSFCWTLKDERQGMCGDTGGPPHYQASISAQRGDTLEIAWDTADAPNHVTLRIYSIGTQNPLVERDLRPANPTTFVAALEAGSYNAIVSTRWDEGDSSYGVRLDLA